MKERITTLISTAIQSLQAAGEFPANLDVGIRVDRTRDSTHGDFASNIAMSLAKPCRRPPREIANAIVGALPPAEELERVEIAGPGFINFFVTRKSVYQELARILAQGKAYGRSTVGNGVRFQVEFVSANPTGPLHVGHGRGAAYGASVANLLEAAGYEVQREYYVNDAGRQMNILAVSIWLRYLGLCNVDIPFPSNGYRGDYIIDIAKSFLANEGHTFLADRKDLMADLPPDEADGGDKEIYIDALISRSETLLGKTRYQTLYQFGLDSILAEIREDLLEFGVHYDKWFSEASLSEDVDRAIKKLQASGNVYEQDGALWFRSTAFGDDKDRVVKRENGETTYFASDIAYHMNKFERGFDHVINVWGADHHGYIARVKASIAAMGTEPERLTVRLVQFANLYRHGERVQMSTRSGSFVTIRELRSEVGNDAARFYYVTRKPEQHMEFDLEIAKSQSKDNPVYYIQYAHARVCSMFRKLAETEGNWNPQSGLAQLEQLTDEKELQLISKLSSYPNVVLNAAQQCEPHQLTHYLKELASEFHGYYNSHKILVENESLRQARVVLSAAVRQVIANGLALLGVSAPEEM